MIVWATTQVAALATSAAPTPSHIGRRSRRCAPLKLAISAARIRTASRPSRKTMIAVFVITVVRLFGPVPTASSASLSARVERDAVGGDLGRRAAAVDQRREAVVSPAPYQKRPSLRAKSSGARPRRRCSGPSSKNA